MKIRIIKKLAKSKKLTTNKLKSDFKKSILKSKTIRNIIMRGMIRNKKYTELTKFMIDTGELKVNLKVVETLV